MGRKGVSITFYESELEDMAKLKEVEEKYNMPIKPLLLNDLEAFEKTIKEALKYACLFECKLVLKSIGGLKFSKELTTCQCIRDRSCYPSSRCVLHSGVCDSVDGAYRGVKKYFYGDSEVPTGNQGEVTIL